MTARKFHLLLVLFLLIACGLTLFIDHPADAAVPHSHAHPVAGTVQIGSAQTGNAGDSAREPDRWLSPPTPPPAPAGITPPGPAAQPDADGLLTPGHSRALLLRWRNFPVEACVYLDNARIFDNHVALGPYGRVSDRLAPVDRGKLWNMFCRLTRQNPEDLDTLGLDGLMHQAEQADAVAWLATTRQAFQAHLGEALPADWDRQEGSPRGTLLWWLALQFPEGTVAPAPAGGFKAAGSLAHTPTQSDAPLFTVTAGSLTLYATRDGNRLLISPSQRVLRAALDEAPPATAATANRATGFHEFRAHVAQTPDAELHAFAEGELLALAMEQGHVPDFYIQLAQVRLCDRLLIDGVFRRQELDLTASVEVPQHSVYDFIALDGPRQLDRFLPSDLFGYANLRINLSGLINYAATLASQGYFGAKAQQAAMLAGPLLKMSNLPAAFGNELTAALAPAEDKTYLAWSFAVPWRKPHTLQEIATISGLAGAPFDGPSVYKGETLITPKFKAKMEFRYPVLIQVPNAYDSPAPPLPPAPPVPATPSAPPTPSAPAIPAVKDSVLLIAANGWNLPDVLNVKQGRHSNLADATAFQQVRQDKAGDSAIQIYLNLTHGFGYAYVTALGELYGLPFGGVPIEEDQLPRSEAFGPMGTLWISISRAKLPDATPTLTPLPPAVEPAKPPDKMSYLKFHLVWKME